MTTFALGLAACGSETVERVPLPDAGDSGVVSGRDSGPGGTADSGPVASPDGGPGNPVDAGVVLPDAGPLPTDVPAPAAAEQMAAAWCAQYSRCEPANYEYYSYTPETCLADVVPFFQLDFRLFGASIAAGRAAFSQAQFDRCLNEMATASCSLLSWEGGTAACASFALGRQGLDAACLVNAGECALGLACESGGAECGRCAPRVGPGEDCTVRSCREDLECVETELGAVCVPRAIEGGGCGTIETGICPDTSACVSGVCQPELTTVGAACSAIDPALSNCSFAAGFFCQQPNEAAPGVCAALAFSPVGGSCTTENEACTVDAFCELQANDQAICTQRPAAGAPCAIDGSCANGNYCDPLLVPPTCVAFKAAGAACAESSECSGALYCVDGLCGDLMYTRCD